MQLESVIVRCGVASGDVRRLCRAGGEVWQEHGQVTTAGGIVWRYVLVRVPVAAAIRLGLVTLGAELAEVDDSAAHRRRGAHPHGQDTGPGGDAA